MDQQTEANFAANQPIPQKQTSTFTIVILFILVLFSLVGVGLIYWQNTQLQKELAALTVSKTTNPINNLKPTTVLTNRPTSLTGWITKQSEVLGIAFQHPPKLSLVDLSGMEVKGETGTQFCMIFNGSLSQHLVDQAYAGYGPCGSGVFNLGAVSKDYSAGREGGYGDYSGYVFNNGKFYARFINSIGSTALPSELVTEEVNDWGVKYLLVRGKNQLYDRGGDQVNMPIPGTPGEGYMGALVNIDGNQKYEGFNLSMELKTPEDEQIFKQILSTLQFTGK